MVVGSAPKLEGGLKTEAFTETGRDTGTGSGVGRCFKKTPNIMHACRNKPSFELTDAVGHVKIWGGDGTRKSC